MLALKINHHYVRALEIYVVHKQSKKQEICRTMMSFGEGSITITINWKCRTLYFYICCECLIEKDVFHR